MFLLCPRATRPPEPTLCCDKYGAKSAISELIKSRISTLASTWQLNHSMSVGGRVSSMRVIQDESSSPILGTLKQSTTKLQMMGIGEKVPPKSVSQEMSRWPSTIMLRPSCLRDEPTDLAKPWNHERLVTLTEKSVQAAEKVMRSSVTLGKN